MVFTVQNFSCYASCQSYNVKEFATACNSFSAKFSEGTYVLSGEIDCGAWAFCHSISDVGKKDIVLDTASFYIDNQRIDNSKVNDLVCYIHKSMPNSMFIRNMTFRKYIRRQLRKHLSEYSEIDLLDMFNVPAEYSERKIKYLGGGRYFPILNAIDGIIANKRVFTASFQGQFEQDNFVLDVISSVLNLKKCVFLIPASTKRDFKPSYKIINMSSLFDNEQLRNKYRT